MHSVACESGWCMAGRETENPSGAVVGVAAGGARNVLPVAQRGVQSAAPP